MSIVIRWDGNGWRWVAKAWGDNIGVKLAMLMDKEMQ